jgi:hypothetical protein
MKDVTGLDRVSIFGDKLSFYIPHEWVETIDDDHYLIIVRKLNPGGFE